MRWDDLFEELEAEFAAAIRQENYSEITDMVHAEVATITLASRLRRRVGQEVNIRLRNGQIRRGTVREANHLWTMLHDGPRRYLIPHTAVSLAWPLGAAAPDETGIASRLTLGYALRRIAGAGLDVRIVTDGGEVSGRIALVGSDYCDVWGQAANVVIPWHAIVAIEA